ncbi:hypothetical protein DL93DRAFT_2092189 [Clavulina sp. PMI_390]|nr:hypothetical protein DL93DRAFT_2092189 [Clavulina sp. PMI_390]
MSLPRRSSRAHATPLDVHSALETPQKVISLTDDDASMYEKPQQDIEAGQPVDITSRAIISPNATSVVQSDLD